MSSIRRPQPSPTCFPPPAAFPVAATPAAAAPSFCLQPQPCLRRLPSPSASSRRSACHHRCGARCAAIGQSRSHGLLDVVGMFVQLTHSLCSCNSHPIPLLQTSPKPIKVPDHGLQRQDSFPGQRRWSASAARAPARTAHARMTAPAAPGTLVNSCLVAHLLRFHRTPTCRAEICSTPSEVGIFEVAHNKSLGPDGKFSWKKVRTMKAAHEGFNAAFGCS